MLKSTESPVHITWAVGKGGVRSPLPVRNMSFYLLLYCFCYTLCIGCHLDRLIRVKIVRLTVVMAEPLLRDTIALKTHVMTERMEPLCDWVPLPHCIVRKSFLQQFGKVIENNVDEI